MKKCAEFKDVSREDGKTQRRCARYEETSTDILVKDNDNQSLGLIVPEPLAGLADIKADDFMYPMYGAAAAGLGVIIARRWGHMLHARIPEFAGVAGAVIGVALSMPLYWAKGQDAMTQAAISAVLVGLSIYGLPIVESAIYSMTAAPVGLLTAAQVGAIPQISDSGGMPASVRHQVDTGSYGQVY
jgi:hypothetical protein